MSASRAWTASTATRTTRRDLSSRGASRLRVLVEVVALGLAGLAVWRLFDRGLTGIAPETTAPATGAPGAPTVATPVQVDTGVDLLMAAPKCGRVKSARIMEQCRISPSKTVGGLSERQRHELLAYFGG